MVVRWSGYGSLVALSSPTHDTVLGRLLFVLLGLGYGVGFIRSNLSFELLLSLVEFALATSLPLLNVRLGEGDCGGCASEHSDDVGLWIEKVERYADTLEVARNRSV